MRYCANDGPPTIASVRPPGRRGTTLSLSGGKTHLNIAEVEYPMHFDSEGKSQIRSFLFLFLFNFLFHENDIWRAEEITTDAREKQDPNL